MKAIIVDDEKLSLEFLLDQVKEITVIKEVKWFLNPLEAIEYVKNNFIDIAFLDIEMHSINGIALSKRIKELIPSVSIIFITAHPHFASEAYKIRAEGYLIKPAFTEDIEAEISYILRGVKPKSPNRIVIKTFGNFDISIDGRPVIFSRAKSKELLAYLVDRKGGFITNGQAISILWENRTNDSTTNSLFRTIKASLIADLKAKQADDILIRGRNNLAIDIEKVDCDYYKFLKGDTSAINSFLDEYMIEYSWAECTTASLMQKMQHLSASANESKAAL